jgi:hypothetical protein
LDCSLTHSHIPHPLIHYLFLLCHTFAMRKAAIQERWCCRRVWDMHAGHSRRSRLRRQRVQAHVPPRLHSRVRAAGRGRQRRCGRRCCWCGQGQRRQAQEDKEEEQHDGHQLNRMHVPGVLSASAGALRVAPPTLTLSCVCLLFGLRPRLPYRLVLVSHSFSLLAVCLSSAPIPLPCLPQ